MYLLVCAPHQPETQQFEGLDPQFFRGGCQQLKHSPKNNNQHSVQRIQQLKMDPLTTTNKVYREFSSLKWTHKQQLTKCTENSEA